MPRIGRRLGRIPGVVALTALAALFAVGGTWTPSSHWRTTVPGQRSVAHPAGAVAALTAVATAAGEAAEAREAAARAAAAPVAAPVDPGSRRVPSAAARTQVVEAPQPAPKPPAPKPPKYSGRNHLWIPALGISERIVWFPCPRQRPPDHYTYRWGCAGTNNVYILGHASSVMKPLHDAYVAGRLRVGMVAYYANGNGVVTKYAVKFWRLTRPVGTTEWWIAPQPVPSLTLQTCYGRNSEWRLKVRLVAVR